MAERTDLTGQKFGRWTVLYRAEDKRRGYPRWKCRCDCGEERVVDCRSLRKGKSRSCGCLRYGNNRQHGLGERPEYNAWYSMLQRCENPSNKNYPDYGARGITVCQGWHDVSNFFADMGERPSKKHSLDRIDNNDGYHCGHCEECTAKGWKANCRWATIEVQNNNRRPPKPYKKRRG